MDKCFICGESIGHQIDAWRLETGWFFVKICPACVDALKNVILAARKEKEND